MLITLFILDSKDRECYNKIVIDMKKIAIINDIHGNYLLLEKVLRKLREQNIDNYIIGGDLVTDGFENNLVIDTVKSLTKYVVQGNRDEDIALYDGIKWKDNEHYKNMLYCYNELTEENKEYLKQLPKYLIINIAGKKIFVSHALPGNIREIIKPFMTSLFDELIKKYDCDIYLFAHTHQNFDVKYKNRLFINAGAINCSSSGNKGSYYGILTIEDNNVKYEQNIYEYDFNELTNYYLTSDYYKFCPEWTNLILYNLKTGLDNCCPFFDNYNESLSYQDNFKKYMEERNFEIY